MRRNTDIYSSDADAEVLADYVIALVTTNESEASIKGNCLASLADFLQDCEHLVEQACACLTH
jgi:hypothetical protein